MQTKFESIQKDFFKNKDQTTLYKKYYIKAGDLILCTILRKKKKDLFISCELLGWSNHQQKHVPLQYSAYANELKESSNFDYEKLLLEYSNIVQNFSIYLTSFQYLWQCKELFHHLENPKTIHHYKILNTFTSAELQKLDYSKHTLRPILNTYLFQSKPTKKIRVNEALLCNYINGYFFSIGRVCSDFIEISVDLDESDEAIIEKNGITISKEELFTML